MVSHGGRINTAVCKEYMYKPRLDEDTLAGDFIAMAMGSAADLCIVPMQDYLGLGSDARINTPSTLGGNWEWRMKPGEPDEGTVREMERMTKYTDGCVLLK